MVNCLGLRQILRNLHDSLYNILHILTQLIQIFNFVSERDFELPIALYVTALLDSTIICV